MDYLQKFQRKVIKTYQLLFIAIGQEIQRQLTLEERNYPNITVRKYGRGTTGKYADSPRDTIDSKSLYNSFDLKLNTSLTKIMADYSYSKDYAAIIYFGYLTSKGYRIVPYPWIEAAIAKLNLAQMFKDIWDAI